MASYLSYFTSNSSSAPSQQQYKQGQPATSTWTNSVSSRLAGLRKALTRDSEVDDPEFEDCSHISNVLRAFYQQRDGRLPDWLPPDPRKPVSQPAVQSYGQYGSNVYGNQQGTPAHSRGASGGRGGLSDLWDSGPAQTNPAPQTQSLRTPRPTPQSLRGHENTSKPMTHDPYSSQLNSGARPLPSQRAGSFQNTAAAGTGKDRLRARLQGGGSGRNSPVPNHYSSSAPALDDDSYGNQQYGSGGNNYGGNAYRQRAGGPR